MSSIWRYLKHWDALQRFVTNCYFLIGLAVQKGTPLLVVPLTLSVIGTAVYSEYVVLYSVVQIVSVVGGLSIWQALIPFWYEHQEKGSFAGSFLCLMTAVQVASSCLIGALVLLLKSHVHYAGVSFPVLILVLTYAGCYNLNNASLSIIRVQNRQRTFFWATASTSALFIISVLALRFVKDNQLLWYTSLNILVLAAQGVWYIVASQLHYELLPWPLIKHLFEKTLRFALPLSVYTVVTLAGLVLDKWLVKLCFEQTVLSRYVLDFQFAFALTLVSTTVGFYNTQRICELVHEKDRQGLRGNIVGNYILVLVGSLGLGVACFTYAHFGHIRLSWGYWVLVLAFSFNNCYGVNSAVLTGQRRTKPLAVAGFICTTAFAIALLAAGYFRLLGIVYWAYVAYYGLLFLFSGIWVFPLLVTTGSDVRQIWEAEKQNEFGLG